MKKDKEYIKSGGQYFSGQGYVCLETDNKVYELGNCTDLVFYNDGKFNLVWEKFYSKNIELLLGENCGEEDITPFGTEKEIKFTKFKINKNTTKNCILHFDGVNTADSDRKILVKANVQIKMARFLPLINDELAAFLTEGVWTGDLEIFLPYQEAKSVELKTTPDYYTHSDYEPPKIKLSNRGGKFVKILSLVDSKNVTYNVIGMFNTEHVTCLKTVGTERSPESTKVVLVSDYVLVELPMQDVANFLDRVNKKELDMAEHAEKTTGKRLVDYMYRVSNSNKIKFGEEYEQ